MLAVFVAPMFSAAASQMIAAAVSCEGVRVAVVSQEPLERLNEPLASRLVGHWRVDDVTDAAQLEWAVRGLAARLGAIAHCFGAFEQLQVPLAEVREQLGIPGMSAETARNFRDKARMKDALRNAGVPVARHRLITQSADASAFVREVGFPIVVKPPAGAGARATHRIGDIHAMDALLRADPPSAHDPMLAEEFLRGTEHSLETISIAGVPVWHSMTHYYPTPLDVIENPWIQWGVVLPRESNDASFTDIRETGDRALAALGMDTGVSHCEWFRRTDGTVAISEIAARPPGAQITTMMSRAHEFDFVAAWMRVMLFGTFVPPTRQYAVGTAYLRGQGAGRIRSVDGIDAVHRELGKLICDARLPTVGHAPTGSYEGEGFIMLRHPDTAVVQQGLTRVLELVRVWLQ